VRRTPRGEGEGGSVERESVIPFTFFKRRDAYAQEREERRVVDPFIGGKRKCVCMCVRGTKAATVFSFEIEK